MANIQSQIKRNRQNEKRRLRNRDFRGAARTAVKDAFAAMAPDQDPSAAVTAAIRALDKAARKGAIHQRNAARRKSRLLKRLAAMGLHAELGAKQPSLPTMAPAPTAERGRPQKPAPETKAKPKPEAKKPAAKAPAKKAAPKKTPKK